MNSHIDKSMYALIHKDVDPKDFDSLYSKYNGLPRDIEVTSTGINIYVKITCLAASQNGWQLRPKPLALPFGSM